jgi:hypothetical protein
MSAGTFMLDFSLKFQTWFTSRCAMLTFDELAGMHQLFAGMSTG